MSTLLLIKAGYNFLLSFLFSQLHYYSPHFCGDTISAVVASIPAYSENEHFARSTNLSETSLAKANTLILRYPRSEDRGNGHYPGLKIVAIDAIQV